MLDRDHKFGPLPVRPHGGFCKLQTDNLRHLHLHVVIHVEKWRVPDGEYPRVDVAPSLVHVHWEYRLVAASIQSPTIPVYNYLYYTARIDSSLSIQCFLIIPRTILDMFSFQCMFCQFSWEPMPYSLESLLEYNHPNSTRFCKKGKKMVATFSVLRCTCTLSRTQSHTYT